MRRRIRRRIPVEAKLAEFLAQQLQIPDMQRPGVVAPGDQARAVRTEALRREPRLLGRLQTRDLHPSVGLNQADRAGKSSTARSRPSAEKQPQGPPILGPSLQVPTRHRRQPPALVSSQRPSGLNVGLHCFGTGSFMTSRPDAASQILAPNPSLLLWLPVATHSPFGLTEQCRTSCWAK